MSCYFVAHYDYTVLLSENWFTNVAVELYKMKSGTCMFGICESWVTRQCADFGIPTQIQALWLQKAFGWF